MSFSNKQSEATARVAKSSSDDEHGVHEHELLEPQPERSWFMDPIKYGVFLIATAALGFLASYDLSIEKVKKLENPDRVLSCDFNPFFSCGSVMEFWQAQLFNFPNQFIGIAAFVFPLLIGVMLVSRTEIPGWIMVGLNIGLLGGVALVIFLYISSIFVIGIGCPWCIVVWALVIPMFTVTTGRNMLAGNFGTGVYKSAVLTVLARQSLVLGIVAVFLILFSIVITFWTFFGSLF